MGSSRRQTSFPSSHGRSSRSSAATITKGSRILVEGRLQARSYDAQDGSKRYVTEVVANDIEFAGSRPQGAGAPGTPMQSSAPSHQPPAGQESFGPSIPDEEIPF